MNKEQERRSLIESNISFGKSVKEFHKEVINLIGSKGEWNETDLKVINYAARQVGKIDGFIERNRLKLEDGIWKQ